MDIDDIIQEVSDTKSNLNSFIKYYNHEFKFCDFVKSSAFFMEKHEAVPYIRFNLNNNINFDFIIGGKVLFKFVISIKNRCMYIYNNGIIFFRIDIDDLRHFDPLEFILSDSQNSRELSHCDDLDKFYKLIKT